MRDTDRQRSLELIEEAVREVNRIEGTKPDRALLLVGIANQLVSVDRVRAWEIIGEAVKEANRIEGFTGENTVHFPLMTGSGVRFQTIGGENFSLATVFRALAKDDLYRAVDVAKSFKYEAPRATVTLAIASSILVREADGSIKPGGASPRIAVDKKEHEPAIVGDSCRPLSRAHLMLNASNLGLAPQALCCRPLSRAPIDQRSEMLTARTTPSPISICN